MTVSWTPGCPLPTSRHERVQMAHGGGGRLMRDLIEDLITPAFGAEDPASRHDSAILPFPVGRRLALTTDSYVVKPLFFPGGDIGSLAVNGTVNDLAMSGAWPWAITCAFILEEGLPMADLQRVVLSMRATADAAGVRIVTGDTKVVERGKGDGLFVNTAGVGVGPRGGPIAPSQIRMGDRILVSGDVGRHGIAIMAAREGLDLETTVTSDCAPLWAPVQALLAAGVEVRCLRDLTRGGLGAALCEIAEASAMTLRIEETAVDVREDVRAVCEILGLDPLYVANEGRFIAFVSPDTADLALAALARHDVSRKAHVLGEVVAEEGGVVLMRTAFGPVRVVDLPSGEQLPRIC